MPKQRFRASSTSRYRLVAALASMGPSNKAIVKALHLCLVGPRIKYTGKAPRVAKAGAGNVLSWPKTVPRPSRCQSHFVSQLTVQNRDDDHTTLSAKTLMAGWRHVGMASRADGRRRGCERPSTIEVKWRIVSHIMVTFVDMSLLMRLLEE